MSVRRLAREQPEEFAFSSDNWEWAKQQIAKYPEGKQASAVIPLLWRAQEQNGGWLSEPAIRYVAGILDMAHIRVLEIATFYTMFNLSPVGQYYVQLCGTTPCWLRGADELKSVCRKVIGEQGQVSDDGKFSWLEVECLGACVNAPMVQINDDFYEDLDAETFERLLEDLSEGREVKPGPQIERQLSAPVTGLTALIVGVEEEYRNQKVAGKPPALSEARDGQADDLKRIAGIGPIIETTLNQLGIFHFDQIAEWSPAHIDWVDDYLKFKGRIHREDWRGQSRILADGGVTEFARRYDAGDINTDLDDERQGDNGQAEEER